MNTLAQVAAQTAGEPVTLTAAGVVMMTLCVALVLGLNVFCLVCMLRAPQPSEHHHAPLDIDTHDLER